MLSRACLLTLLTTFVACGPQTTEEVDDAFAESSSSLNVEPASAELILALVNYPGTDLATLDEKVGLDARAAQNILARRDGADGTSPSGDDDAFDTIAELDAVAYVGDVALSKLLAHAQTSPAPKGEVVESVAFTGWEAEAVIWAVNTAPAGVLDGMMDARAAQALIAGRPFVSVTHLGPVAYVGSSALTRLQREARTWWAAMRSGPAPTLAGTFDGVQFDLATATVTLDLANRATREQLTGKGVQSSAATALVAARAYVTLAEVAAVSGVGPATMQALKTWAVSGTWNGPAAPVTPSPLSETQRGRAALLSYIEDVIFDVTNPAGQSFRSNILDWRPPETVAGIRSQLEAEAASWSPSGADWERFEGGDTVTYAGRFFQLYTEIRFKPNGVTEVSIEID